MNPDTGRLFTQMAPGLVPAPFANRHQIRRMSVMRNEPCPCGSGKKFKKCCLGKIAPTPQPHWMPPGPQT